MSANIQDIPDFAREQMFYRGKVSDSMDSDTEFEVHKNDRRVVRYDEANLISSLSSNTTWHRPIIDIDIPAALVPSSTPGHNHLYIDCLISSHAYGALLTALEAAGIVQGGIVRQFNLLGETVVRAPHVKKGGELENQINAEFDSEKHKIQQEIKALQARLDAL